MEEGEIAMEKYRVTLSSEERETLASLVSKGKAAARKLLRARVLLLADEGPEGPGKADTDIVDALGCGQRTISRVRRAFVTEGIEEAISRKPQPPRPNKVKINGDVEKKLIQVACSDPPEGRSYWTMQLLADQLVILGYVETVGRESVRTILKKAWDRSLDRKNMVYAQRGKSRIRVAHGGYTGAL
jgi:hypothetical protein